MHLSVFFQRTASQSVSCSVGKKVFNSRRKKNGRKCVSTSFFISGHSPAFAFIEFLSLSLNTRLSSADSRPLFFGTPFLIPLHCSAAVFNFHATLFVRLVSALFHVCIIPNAIHRWCSQRAKYNVTNAAIVRPLCKHWTRLSPFRARN